MEPSSSYKTKLARRKKKYAAMLLKETGLHEVHKSKFLLICNTGLVSGSTAEDVLELFSQYCSVQNILMVPGKSYCFVQCSDENEAENAHNAINAKLSLPGVNGPLYLLYSESMPQQDSKINFHYRPDGLILIDDFISGTEEQLLLDMVHDDFKNTSNTLKHRLVRHYGYEFDYNTNNVNKSNKCEDIPSKYSFLIERIQNHEKLKNWVPNQITINCYQPGQGIPFHVDTHSAFDDYILSLSIGSDIVMEFKNAQERCSLLLQRKSLLIMSDASRYVWSHGIVPRKYDIIENDAKLTTQARGERISFTFRRIRDGDSCNCDFVDNCDSKKKNQPCGSLEIGDDVASKLERTHVHEVYDEIANHFSETRHKPWPNVESFIRSFLPGSIFIDVGCGNGKYLGLNASAYQMGCDRNVKLAQECFKKGFEALICDCLELPFRSNVTDYCICIAVIHHLATESRRIRAIQEIIRILRPGGQALIYVWAKNQLKDEKSSNYLKINRNKDFAAGKVIEDTRSVEFKTSIENADEINGEKKTDVNISLPVHVNRTQFKHEDMLVPWKLKQKQDESEVPTFLRFYHVFSEGELESLCKRIPGNRVMKSYYDQGNWCVILEKL
ncbi:alkylated DNA repair protein alkB homolog 8 [Planococcus citri]|uniref:alkylated DNA repair protein alkB homolog 8 n=1 Tax=Planococcus citri TaxID=170843 RepID=UPI0031F72E1B